MGRLRKFSLSPDFLAILIDVRKSKENGDIPAYESFVAEADAMIDDLDDVEGQGDVQAAMRDALDDACGEI